MACSPISAIRTRTKTTPSRRCVPASPQINGVGALPAPQRLQVRIGIATGLVVVGDLTGTGSAREQAVVGETPNLAARLQALAEPNAIVIAESTRRQVAARFEVADLGPQSMKGFTKPQRAWRVLSENRALGRFEARRSGATPLVGRDEEMELLLRRWAQAKARSGRTVLICAEPGVGKSRLAEALAERIATEPHPSRGTSDAKRIVAGDVSSRARAAGTRVVLAREIGANGVVALIALGPDGANASLLSRVTRKSLESLGLAAGASVYAQVKAVALALAGAAGSHERSGRSAGRVEWRAGQHAARRWRAPVVFRCG